MKLVIYGAKSIALGIEKALSVLYRDCPVICFAVQSLDNNPSELDGIRVREIGELSASLHVTHTDKNDIHVVIGTPEDIHPGIVKILEQHGFYHYTCMDSRKEAKLMERYFAEISKYPSLHSLTMGESSAGFQVFMAKCYKDKPLKIVYHLPEWIHPLQVGAELTDRRVAELADNTGENISGKNVNYCELTALYWIWKNRLTTSPESEYDKTDYYGLFHYRRILDITDEDLLRMKENDVDAVLPFPMLHAPDIREHHTRYIGEADWKAMLAALEELQPQYAAALPEIFSQEYFYNYNMIVARKDVLAEYCAWLFPILERTEELSVPRGCERADRYIGYLGENLMTLYFMYHQERLRILHTGRLMLT